MSETFVHQNPLTASLRAFHIAFNMLEAFASLAEQPKKSLRGALTIFKPRLAHI
jgi:hypothetical protein